MNLFEACLSQDVINVTNLLQNKTLVNNEKSNDLYLESFASNLEWNSKTNKTNYIKILNLLIENDFSISLDALKWFFVYQSYESIKVLTKNKNVEKMISDNAYYLFYHSCNTANFESLFYLMETNEDKIKNSGNDYSVPLKQAVNRILHLTMEKENSIVLLEFFIEKGFLLKNEVMDVVFEHYYFQSASPDEQEKIIKKIDSFKSIRDKNILEKDFKELKVTKSLKI